MNASVRVTPPDAPHGDHIYEAQVELGYAWDMLEVLVQLTMEATDSDPLPPAGWFGLLTSVQERVGGESRVKEMPGLARHVMAYMRSEGLPCSVSCSRSLMSVYNASVV